MVCRAYALVEAHALDDVARVFHLRITTEHMRTAYAARYSGLRTMRLHTHLRAHIRQRDRDVVVRDREVRVRLRWWSRHCTHSEVSQWRMTVCTRHRREE